MPLLAALALFLVLAAHQLDLPGLHYDEAREAGINAMQLIAGQPLTAFRDATLDIGALRLPLMVQDYIGALNVVLALPFLAVGGINVAALRWLPLVIAALTLITVWRCAWRLGGPLAGAAAALLLAVNPSFIFWSRQGVFVTNITALLFMASLLTGLRWWQARRSADLWLTAFLWGLGIYAKLLFVWAIGAMVMVAAGAWLLEAKSWKLKAGKQNAGASSGEVEKRQEEPQRPRHHPATHASTLIVTLACFLIPLAPLIIFNLRTEGTLIAIFGNLGRSYYGVDNSAFLANLGVRLEQVLTLLRGNHFWYLGGPIDNTWAPWLAAGLVILASIAWAVARAAGHRWPPTFLLPIALLALMVAQSAFTVSDLFITHYALLLPLIPLAGGLALGAVWGHDGRTRPRPLPVSERVSMPHPAPWLMKMQRSTLSGGPQPEVEGRGAVIQAEPHRSAERLRRSPSTGQHLLSVLARSPAQDARSLSKQPPERARRFAQAALLILASLAALAWAGGDLGTTVRYHRVLAASGGYATHSDAISRLAAYLDQAGYATPVALDWGIDAPVRFLTAGRISPIEIFGYERLDAADEGFAGRVVPLLQDSSTVYVGHRPDKAVFQGRVEVMAELAAREKRLWLQEAWFSDRSGEVLFIIYRAIPGG